MGLPRVIGVLQPLVFVAVAIVALVHWRRRQSQAAAWLARMVLILVVLVAFGRLVQPGDTGLAADVGRRVLAPLLACFPYSLYRFATSLTGRRPRQDRLALVGTIVIGTAAAVLPLGQAADLGWPWWMRAFALVLAVQWTTLSFVAVGALWGRRLRLPGVTRRRMRLLATAALVLNVALLMVLGSGGRHGPSASAGQQAVALVSGLLFLVGFSPPAALRTAWRRDEMDAFRDGEAELMSADSEARVARVVLPHAIELVGASAAVLVDGHGTVRAHRGVDDAGAQVIAERLPPARDAGDLPVFLPDLVAVPVGPGWLAVATTPATPLFGREEIGLLGTLAHLADLALDRIELLDKERVSRQALAEREFQLAEAQRTARIGSYAWDAQTGQLTWSDEMYRILGLAPGYDADLARALAARIHAADREQVLAAWATARATSAPSDIEYRIVLPDGQVRWIHGRVQPVPDRSRPGLIGTVQDVTDRKRAEAGLRDAFEREQHMVAELRELARVKTDFLSTISHELRTPLTSIAGYIELLTDGAVGDLTPRQVEVLDVIERNARRLTTLIEDLLTLSRVDAGGLDMVLAPVDIRALVESVHRAVLPSAFHRRVGLDVDVSPDVGVLVADGGQVDRVLLNLLTNAIKFTPDAGQVDLRVWRDGDRMCFEVADNGIGIPADEQAQLFSRFFRSSTAMSLAIPGTGLGLAIVKTIVEQHGGTIDIVSSPGAGTTVRFSLPAPAGSAGELPHQHQVAL